MEKVTVISGASEGAYQSAISEEVMRARILSRQEAKALLGQSVRNYNGYSYAQVKNRIYVVRMDKKNEKIKEVFDLIMV